MGKTLGCFLSLNIPDPSHSLILKTARIRKSISLPGRRAVLFWFPCQSGGRACVLCAVAEDRRQAGLHTGYLRTLPLTNAAPCSDSYQAVQESCGAHMQPDLGWCGPPRAKPRLTSVSSAPHPSQRLIWQDIKTTTEL